MGGAGIITLLILVLIGAIAVAGVGIFAPVRLAVAQERALELLHGGIADTFEETYVDGCVRVPGADAPRAVTRTRRIVTFRDGTSFEVVFSGKPQPTNACP